jgi:hypothetical protein
MVSSEELIKIVKELYKSEQNTGEELLKIPQEGVLLSLFRTFENRLIERQMLPDPQSSGFNPIWFLGETERNIFLWRNKKSIKDADDYAFWLDVRKLISKRLAQLENSNPDNPFLNPLWGCPSGTLDNCPNEKRYLSEFLKLYGPAEPHLAAISAVQALVITAENPVKSEGLRSLKIVSIPLNPMQH